jgi:hypothetical protein
MTVSYWLHCPTLTCKEDGNEDGVRRRHEYFLSTMELVRVFRKNRLRDVWPREEKVQLVYMYVEELITR